MLDMAIQVPYKSGINNDGIKYEDALVDQPNKIVTCLRFGNSSISKSEIINKVLSENIIIHFISLKLSNGHSQYPFNGSSGNFRFAKIKGTRKIFNRMHSAIQRIGIKNDEEIEPFVQVNRKTNVIMEKIGDKPKKQILPLQAKLWTEWSFIKAYNRVGTNTQYKDKNRIKEK
ncbi:unnamed protein product [Mytilus edulis]|uniref:Up-regulator of cell proliferation-like domain-containing protein n=1 Tax=Mytilus edulis TaxID=6550 RepID=A0A8S3UUM6_MYTED|nr:unnamed protein product [Mytilus edulis]